MGMRRLVWIEGATGGSGLWSGTTVRTCEAAGHAHSAYSARRFAQSAAPSSSENDEEGADAPPTGAHAKKRAPAARFVDGKDPYEMLGLGEIRYSATDDDIKASYKKMVLVHHPDKGGSEEAFKAIQAAYELLSDPRKRRIFDSSDEVDDSIPAATDTRDFFSLYRPVFERLGRFSQKQPVPNMGNVESSDEHVDKFYTFWFVFDSWREFSHADEYDPEQAESRDEKRWMERQNEKGRQKKKRDEIERTARLVEQAHRLDPRVQAMRAREKAAKQAERDAKRAAVEAREREAEESKRAATAAADEKAKTEATAKEQMRRKVQSARARVTALVEPLMGKEFNSDHLTLLMNYSPLTRLTSLIKALEGGTGMPALTAELQIVEGERAEAIAKEAGEKGVRSKELEGGSGKEWTPEELSSLVRALAKFPGGQTKRWEAVAGFIGTGRTVKEVIAKTNSLKSAAAANKPGASREAASSGSTEAKKSSTPSPVPAAATVAASAPSTNWDAINNSSSLSSPSPSPSPSPSSTSSSGSSITVPAPPSPSPSPPPASADDWSVEQQRALEAALRSCPAALGVTRWDEIAKLVPGKSKKQCVERFKLIAERLKAAKK